MQIRVKMAHISGGHIRPMSGETPCKQGFCAATPLNRVASTCTRAQVKFLNPFQEMAPHIYFSCFVKKSSASQCSATYMATDSCGRFFTERNILESKLSMCEKRVGVFTSPNEFPSVFDSLNSTVNISPILWIVSQSAFGIGSDKY